MKNKPITYKQILEKKNNLPFYVYDFDLIKRQAFKLKNNLPKNVKVIYSVKANPSVAILRIMKEFGFGAEIVSDGELLAVKKANFKLSEVYFAGATKTNEELLLSFKAGVGVFSIESISELERLNRIIDGFNKKAEVMIRINLDDFKRRENRHYTKVSDFGIKLKDFEKILYNFPNNFPNIILKGIHFYQMSRMTNVNILIKGINDFFSVIKGLEKKFNIDFKIINIGGGFESNIRKELSIINYCKKLAILINKYNFNNKRIILELGRYLINNSGIYITEIIDSEKKDDVNFLTVKGIFNHLLRFLVDKSSKNRFIEHKNNFIVEILSRQKKMLHSTVICGQMSSSADTFGRSFDCKFLLPYSTSGDFVLIKGVGSYGLTQALVFFGSRLIAKEFLMINNKLELIRDNKNFLDLVLHQRIPLILNKKCYYKK